MRKPRCWHIWHALTWTKSPLTNRPISATEECEKCQSTRYRVFGVEGSRSHSWWKSGIKKDLGLVIRPLSALDIGPDFFATLGVLSKVNPNNMAINYKKIHHDRLRSGIETFIAILDGKIIGTASLLLEKKFTWGGKLVGHVEDVAVHRDHQKCGVGSALMSYLIDYAKIKECRKIVLDCTAKVASFYEKHHFHQHEISMRLDV